MGPFLASVRGSVRFWLAAGSVPGISIDDKRDNRRAVGAWHDRTPGINRSDVEMIPNIVREKRGKPFDLPPSSQPIYDEPRYPRLNDYPAFG